MTRKIYLENTYQCQSEGVILQAREDEKGKFIILDQTIFYPQGGGQPSDQGTIKNDHFESNVVSVRQVTDEIRHYITGPYDKVPIGLKVYCFVDRERRLLNSRYHTAAHLLGNIAEELYPKLKAIKGHSFPNEAYIEFQGNESVDLVEIQSAINAAIERNSKTKVFETDATSFEREFYKLPYSIPDNKKFRAMQIGDMLPVPCGGTHLSSVGEIGHVSINKIKAKDDILRISYEVR